MKLKHITYSLVFVISFFINIFCVKAECSTEQYDNYRKLASQVKITYKYLEELEREEEPRYGVFEVTISGLSPEIYIYDNNTYKEYYYKESSPITFQTHGGSKSFSINMISSECGTYLIKKVTIDIPKFNSYSIKDYCQGIDTKKFPMCDKWYQFDVTYSSIMEALDSYKKTTTIVSNDDNSNPANDKNNNGIMEFIANNQLYIVIGLSVIFVVLVSIAIATRRKRGALE